MPLDDDPGIGSALQLSGSSGNREEDFVVDESGRVIDSGGNVVHDPVRGGNQETDYVVDERGRVIDSGGNVVKDAITTTTGGGSSGGGSSNFLTNLKNALTGGSGKLGKYIEDNPLQALLMAALFAKSMQGGKPKAAGYTGPGINMGMTASRQPIKQPEYKPYSGQAVMGRQMISPVTYAADGGLMGLARGRYLSGTTDGMADKIPSSIDNKQPAKLSHGEFVIPADVVSHLGNGNSDAGAKVLYKMMDRVRAARTGTKKQGKRINPDKFTPGGIAGYASGGAVAFEAGGQTTAPVNKEENIASWAGPYVMDYLSKGRALAQLPYQAYEGPLTAGYSPLQTKAFTNFENLEQPSQFTTATNLLEKSAKGSFADPGSAQMFMSPYMQNVVDIEKREAQRQADIARTGRGAQAVKAGAFGGSRQGIMEAEAQRNLAQQMGDIQARGSQASYDRAMQQYNAERDAQMRAAMGLGTLGTQQFGSQLQGLQAMLGAGGTQRDIEQQGITALINEYNKQMMWPYQQLEFQRSLLQGLPVSAMSAYQPTDFMQQLSGTLSDIFGFNNMLNTGKPASKG